MCQLVFGADQALVPADLAKDEMSAESHHQLDDSGVEFIEDGETPIAAAKAA